MIYEHKYTQHKNMYIYFCALTFYVYLVLLCIIKMSFNKNEAKIIR